MNFIATHTYSVEPTVWVGTAGNLTADGRIKGGVYNTTPWFRERPRRAPQADQLWLTGLGWGIVLRQRVSEGLHRLR